MSSPNNVQSNFSNHSTSDPITHRNSYNSGPGLSTEPMPLRNSGTGISHAESSSIATAQTHPSLGETLQSNHSQISSSQSMTAPLGTYNAARLNLSTTNLDLPLEERGGEVLRLAIEAFPQTVNWVIFYREILGVEGVARNLFRTNEELSTWESTPQFEEVHTMLAALRSHDTTKGDTVDGQRMITVRIPTSLHEVLKKESDEQSLSINKLCITKLLQKLDPRFAPEEPGKRRGRKPGPQGKRVPKVVA